MIATTFLGESVYLLPYRPNYKSPFTWKISRYVEVDGSQQGPEARTPLNNVLISAFRFELLLTIKDKSDFTVALQRLKNKRVLCPFWPAKHAFYAGEAAYVDSDGEVYVGPGGEAYVSGTGESSYLNAGIWLTYEPDWSHYEIHTTPAATGFTPSANAVRVPLVLGIFANDPDPVPKTDELLSAQIDFRQASPPQYAMSPVDIAFTDGPTVAGRTPQLFPARANWVKGLHAGKATVNIKRDDLGFGTEPAEVYYSQESRRRTQAAFSLFGWEDIAKLAGFFHVRDANVESFWIPGLLSECRIVTATSAGSAVVHVDYAAGLGDNVFVAFVKPGQPPVLRHVESVDVGANTITLDSPPGVFLPGQCNLVSLILARFEKSAIEIVFTTDRAAEASITFVETPSEDGVLSGETYGTTYGPLPSKAFCYRFYRRYPERTVINQFTSFEGNITAGTEVFLSPKGHFDHGAITDSLDIDRTSTEIRSRAFDGNPLMLLNPPQALEVPIEVDVLECNPDEDGVAGPPRMLFAGVATEPDFNGPAVSVQVVSKWRMLMENTPTLVMGPECNYKLFQPRTCALLEINWRFSAQIVSYTPGAIAQLVLGGFARVNGDALPTFDEGWFRFGRLWVDGGTDDDYLSRTIVDSSAISGGEITFKLSYPLNWVPAVGTTISLNPGCSGTVDECKNKFNNYARFGGYPFMPNGDPSFAAVTISTGGGKK